MTWLVLLPWLALFGHTGVNALLLRRLPSEATSERLPSGATAERLPSGATSERLRSGATTGEKVAVLLPLRNEADRVGPCLTALLGQRGVPDLRIVVLDDNSTDGTAAVVRALAGNKVELLTGAPLPDGWLGKPYACQQLADAAADADIVSFVDADVVLEPGALAAAATLLRRADVTLLSPYPKITGAGRLVQPLLQWSWLTFLPVRAMERSPRPSLAAAGGQWLVADRAGYQAAGGHAAVRAEILEDIALARSIKRSGGRVALADGSPSATCEMYASWPSLVAGYSKSLWASFGSGPAAGIVVVTLLLLYASPPVAAVVLLAAGSVTWAAIALVAYLLGVAGRVVTARATGGRAWPDALTHPAAVAVFAWLVARSFRMRRAGALTWRGRPT